MKKQKNLKILILGKSFFITTDENPDDVVRAAELLNDLIHEKQGKSLSSSENKIIIVAALQIATSLQERIREINHYKFAVEKVVNLLNQAL